MNQTAANPETLGTAVCLPILKRVSTFPAMLTSLLVVLSVLTVRARFDDPDMWLHLKMGEVLWNSHHILTTDIFSYTTNHHVFVPHEWLSQLLIFGAYRLAGYTGLMLWLCLFTSALLIGGYFLCSIYSGNTKISLFGALIIWFFGTIGFSIRPHMVGYLLLIAELVLLQLGRTRDPRWFLALPPLFAIWVNCHGSFSLGIALVAILLFSSYFNFQSGSLIAGPWEPRKRRMLLIALCASILALFANPIGTGLVFYPIRALFSMTIGGSAVSEWQPLQMSDGRGLALLGVVGCILLAVVVGRSALFFDELLLLLTATWLAVHHRRMLFVFGILAAPILSRILSSFWDEYDSSRDRHLPNAALMAASLLIAILAIPSRQNLAAQVEDHSPAAAVAFIKAHHPTGPMLNEWVDGEYLIWAAPEYPVFIDGRGDPFDAVGVTEEFGKWAMLESSPDSLLDKYHVNFCLLERGSPMATVLPLLPNWKTVYLDEKSVILVRVSPSTPPG